MRNLTRPDDDYLEYRFTLVTQPNYAAQSPSSDVRKDHPRSLPLRSHVPSYPLSVNTHKLAIQS